MRVLLLGLLGCLLAAPAAGDERPPPLDDAKVQRWIRWLGDPHPTRRRVAYYRLAELGDAAVPVLMKVRTDNLEAARSIRRLTRAARKIQISLAGPTTPHPVGVPLELTLELFNDTEDLYVLPFRQRRGARVRSCFLVYAGDRVFRLSSQQVRGIGEELVLKPSQRASVTVTLSAETGFVQGPGRITVRWAYLARNVVYGPDGETRRLRLRAEPITITAIVRTPAQLARALDGGGDGRLSALAELKARKDAAVLPLLRERFLDASITPIAVKVLGKAGHDEDLALLLPATTKHPSREIRLAAVRALKHFSSSRARRRLTRFVLDHDEELLDAASDALAGHKHARTVAAYIQLMRRPGPWQPKIARRLREWTGMPVSTRDTEIDAFERWFRRRLQEGRPWALSDSRK